MGLKKDRPRITRSNIVCAEPMPGEGQMLKEFVGQLEPKLLGQLVDVVFEKMKLAGEAGSLLKIEEEIRDAVAEARKQWRVGSIVTQMKMFGEQEPVQEQQRFDLSGITDAQFFEQAESKVVDALRNYAERAQNGQWLQRRLFADDAVRGFAFVDLCHKQFDVVLMNPPFGEGSRSAKATFEKQYPRTRSDVYAAFVERGINRLRQQGLLGAITSRSGFYLSSFQKWREEILLEEAAPTVVADLGYGVLDTAMVETAAYCLAKGRENNMTTFIRLLQAEDKEATLRSAVDCGTRRRLATGVFQVALASFNQMPGSPFAYWISKRVIGLFSKLPQLEHGSRVARITNETSNDLRWIRAAWEVPYHCVARSYRWVPHAKGGEYSPYYSDLHLVIAWDEEVQSYPGFEGTANRPDHRPASCEFFFLPGLTWSRRTQRGLSIRPLPAGSIFGNKGPVIISRPEELLPLLAITNSKAFQFLVSLRMTFGSYETGVIQKTPVPWLDSDEVMEIGRLAQSCVSIKQRIDSWQETSHVFIASLVVLVGGGNLATRISESRTIHENNNIKLSELQRTIDEAAYRLYGIDDDDRLTIESTQDSSQSLNETAEVEDSDASLVLDESFVVVDLLSYAVGCLFGRWDVRYASGDRKIPQLPDPFTPLPVCSPGMLQSEDGLPLSKAPQHYPLRIDWDGILVDDPDHRDDIVRRVRDVLEVIWKDRADAIEKEACEILGVSDLRDYFRKPGAGGFWDDHVKRYSKSRRKAPICWLLQSSKKNYALWIYYHRLDKDILFKALLNYVEPKIRREESRLDELRSQKTALGPAAKGVKKLDKDIDRQDGFLSELRDFEDKLRRAANLHLDPDLNDGVVLNIAPLRELVPWKEAKSYWDDLMDGKYEWSSIGKQLREKSMVHGP